jgi:hypothetical protein
MEMGETENACWLLEFLQVCARREKEEGANEKREKCIERRGNEEAMLLLQKIEEKQKEPIR